MLFYTIGHSTRRIEEFIKILRKYGIKLVVDVRRFPVSRKFPQFNREELSKSLKENGIDYFWLGDLLGGYRSGGYRRYVKTDDFKRGIKRLIEVAIDGKTAIMCAEWSAMRCHRWYISDALARLGHEVVHIINVKRCQTHKELSRIRRKK